ncbi:winged helix-turn-helix domain-containing protein, partial [Chloroflexota bacterium]
ESPDIIILDIMLPKIDGFEVCRILRNEMIVPILMLTAKEEEIDKVLGLELGADDYITKPFSMRELKSRIKAMLRRVEMHQSKPAKMNFRMISSGNLKIDESKRRVILDDSEIEMKPKEFDLLTFLVANHGQVFSREQLLKQIWDYDYIGDSRTVDVHIRWLREKIETTPSQPKRLITVRGIGYKFEG